MTISVTLISNALTPHQIPFSDSMYELLEGNFHFISCAALSDERKKIGWGTNNKNYEVKLFESNNQFKYAQQLIENSDIVILGSAPDKLIKKRLKQRKLTFRYSERLYKEGLPLRNLPRAIISSYLHHKRYQKFPIYMLCASAYTAGDLAVFNNYLNRTFKWGYFPEFKEYNLKHLFKKKENDVLQIIWVGRFIDLKYPELAILVAKKLKEKNIKFKLKMIGDGKKFDYIQKKVHEEKLGNVVDLLGSMSPDKVRSHMEDSNIHLFTSDFNEGWGAVLNESMNSGCAVVASHAIGSVPFLINDKYNGLIYRNGDFEDLLSKVLLLVENRDYLQKIGENAYTTIKSSWNAKVAAERFILLAEKMLLGKNFYFEDGPCSKSEPIKNNWYVQKKVNF